MATEHDIKKTAFIISKYLPIWNHLYAQAAKEKENFIQAVNQLDFNESDDNLWKKFGCLIDQYVPDNHIMLKRNGENLVPKKIPTSKTDITKDLPPQHEKIHISDKGDWYIGTKKIGERNIGIVSMGFLSFDESESKDARQKFISRFFELKKENNWKDIIFDFRGNTGGDAQVIKEIAERLAGSTLKYASRIEAVIPDKTDPYRHIFQEKNQDTEMYSFITDNQAERAAGNIYVLQDSWNASAAEGAIFMLTQLKDCKTIGEPTSGTFQSGATVSLNITPETELVIGTKYFEREDKKGNMIEEKKGMKPDIYTKSENAMKKALSTIKLKENIFLQAFSILAQITFNSSDKKKSSPFFKQNNQR